jgi:exosortase C (VPDSG-CTERM-specific)
MPTNEPSNVTDQPRPIAAVAGPATAEPSKGHTGLVAATIILICLFSAPLFHLIRFAVTSELYSHLVLVPFVSGYLVWLGRRTVLNGGKRGARPTKRLALFPLLAGLVVMGGYWLGVHSGWRPTEEDHLAWMTLSFVLLFFSACCLTVRKETLRAMAFPLFFLVFMAPFPTVVREWIETVLQQGSAMMAYALFWLSGMPVLYTDLQFQLPGFSLQVAPVCSGIHSTLVLFLTSLLAAYLFLHTPWRRAVLVLAVIPLGLLRNGFRIFVIGQLCVRIGPEMIHSEIHRNGGPLFFALSLVAFFLLFFFVKRSDHKPLANAHDVVGQAPRLPSFPTKANQDGV